MRISILGLFIAGVLMTGPSVNAAKTHKVGKPLYSENLKELICNELLFSYLDYFEPGDSDDVINSSVQKCVKNSKFVLDERVTPEFIYKGKERRPVDKETASHATIMRFTLTTKDDDNMSCFGTLSKIPRTTSLIDFGKKDKIGDFRIHGSLWAPHIYDCQPD